MPRPKVPKRNKSAQSNQPQQNDNSKRQNSIDKKALLDLHTEKQIGQIKQACSKILIDPETNLKQIETLFVLAKTDKIRVTIASIRHLADLFVNIAPLEAVDLKGLQAREQVTLTKDEYKVLKFEKNLVDQYERYLKMLKQLNSKITATHFNSDQQMFRQFKKCILQCLIKCYKTLWNFNHFKLLNQTLIKFIKHQECKNVLIQLLSSKNLATLQVKSKIVASISKLIKQKNEGLLPDDLVKIVNSTFIDTQYLTKDAEVLKFKKKKLTKKLYKERELEKKKQKQAYRQKKLQKGTLELKKKIKQEKMKQKIKIREEVNKQFAEGETVISNKQLTRSNSQILQEIFYIYFKILVEKINSKFLKDCLDGILTFAHFINIDLISALITHLESASIYLREHWKKQKSNQILESRLLIVFTSESILNGPLSVYNMDDLKVTTAFYKIIRDIRYQNVKLTKQIFRLIGITLEEVLLKRRQLSQEIAGSFVRELSFILLKQQVPKIYLLQLLRLIGSKYNKIGKMFEQDNEGFGINSYTEHCQDPQSNNSINTEIISNLKMLKTSKKKISTEVSDYVERLCRQNFNRIEGTRPLEEILTRDLTTIEYQNS